MKIAEAEAKLRKMLADPPCTEAGASRWARPKWVRFRKLVADLPAGISEAVIDELFAACYAHGTAIDMHDLPAHLDAAVIAQLEVWQRQPPHFNRQIEAGFVLTGFRVGRGGHALLTELLHLAHFLSSDANRAASARLAARPEILEAAQAAVALGDSTSSSSYLPILAADASPGSLDLLLPIIEAARAGGNFDWIQNDLLPLFPDTPHVRAIVAGLTEAKAERAAASPAREFVEQLGMRAPDNVKLTLTFRDAAGGVTYALRIDSARGGGFEGRRNEKWQWNGVAANQIKKHVPATTVDYVLRASAGLDRKKLDAWARALLPR